MYRSLGFGAIVALALGLGVASAHAYTIHFKSAPSFADIDRTAAAQNHIAGIDTGFCIKRAPKTGRRGSPSLLFCYADPAVAYEFYVDNSGQNSDDQDSTTYIQAPDGTVTFAR